MIVSVSGYNYTGSSAIIDLLREYDDIDFVDPEIQALYLPDGLLDLDYHINQAPTYYNEDIGVERFWNLCKHTDLPKEYRKEFLQISREYVDSIIEERWNGVSCFDNTRLSGGAYAVWMCKDFLGSAFFHFFHKAIYLNHRQMYLAHHCENFQKKTEAYLAKIEQLFSKGASILVLNQFFSAFQPERCMKYTPNAKAIIVDRDPRDVYILGKIKRETACYPADSAEKFVAYYKQCWGNRSVQTSESVLHLQFEDAIYHYEESVAKVEQFLGIQNHVSPRKYFNPDMSINNTQLKERFPEMKDEISYIERELSKYLKLRTFEIATFQLQLKTKNVQAQCVLK